MPSFRQEPFGSTVSDKSNVVYNVMNIEDSEAWQSNWQEHCIVCGKSVLDGEGFCHMRVEGEMVAICCPLCFENFEKNPKRYLTLRMLRNPSGLK